MQALFYQEIIIDFIKQFIDQHQYFFFVFLVLSIQTF